MHLFAAIYDCLQREDDIALCVDSHAQLVEN